jgi:hypothetical protein
MAPAKRLFTDEAWPPEGRTLGEIVERMASLEVWDFLTKLVGDRSTGTGGSRQLLNFYLTPETLTYRAAPDGLYATAVNACLPIRDRWNSGEWLAKGRRGSVVAPLEEIPPRRIGWIMVINSLIYSRIIDPGNDRGKIYDLRFYRRKKSATRAGRPQQYDNDAIRAAAGNVIERGIPDTQELFYEKVHDECDGRNIRCHKSATRFRDVVRPIYIAAIEAKKNSH